MAKSKAKIIQAMRTNLPIFQFAAVKSLNFRRTLRGICLTNQLQSIQTPF